MVNGNDPLSKFGVFGRSNDPSQVRFAASTISLTASDIHYCSGYSLSLRSINNHSELGSDPPSHALPLAYRLLCSAGSVRCCCKTLYSAMLLWDWVLPSTFLLFCVVSWPTCDLFDLVPDPLADETVDRSSNATASQLWNRQCQTHLRNRRPT